MIVISQALVLEEGGAFGANNPIIGYQNLATIGNIAATYANAGCPITNVVNPATDLRWLSSSDATQYVTISHNSTEAVDYVSIEEHNLGTGQVVVSIEGFTTAAGWFGLVGEAILPDDTTALFRWAPQALEKVRLKMQPPAGVIPTIAVVFLGKLLVLPRPIYAGHTPITMGRTAEISNRRSESGKFLGRIVLTESLSTSVSLEYLPRSWFRANMLAFIKHAVEETFFFAWRPGEYPREVGYTWLTNDPRPVNAPEGMLTLDLSLAGTAT